MMRFLWIWLLCSLAIAAEIKIGISTPTSGPNEPLGQHLIMGIEAVFQRVNEAGGVRGHHLRLVALDDGMVPEQTKTNTLRLIDEEAVLALMTLVGTSNNLVLPVIEEKRVLLFAPFTGLRTLRFPLRRYVVNLRGDHRDEAEKMLAALFERGIRPGDIAFFIQNDSYGRSGYWHMRGLLEKLGYKNGVSMPVGRHEPNSSDITGAMMTLLESRPRPRALVMFGSYGPVVNAIDMIHRGWSDMLFLCPSGLSVNDLQASLQDPSAHVLTTSVINLPEHAPIYQRFHRDMKRFEGKVDFKIVSFESYLAAEILVEGIRRAPGELDRESLIDGIVAVESYDVGLPEPVSFNPETRQFIHKVWLHDSQSNHANERIPNKKEGTQ